MPKRIKKPKAGKSSTSRINPTELTPKGISFSFKYYQQNHEKYSCSSKEAVYWLTLLGRLKALSGWSAKEFSTNRNAALRCHPISWETTTENGFGLPNEEQLVDTPYQFSLSSNEHGRVHGFMIDEVFYIVWLDPNHLLYPARN